MNVRKIKKDQVTLDLTDDELGLLGNCLNEVCHGIKVLDFESKIGVKINNAQLILKDVSQIYKKMEQEKDCDID